MPSLYFLLLCDKLDIGIVTYSPILLSSVFSAFSICCLVGKCKDRIASSVVIHL